MTAAVVIDVPGSLWPGKLLNANAMRGHSRFHARPVEAWRALSKHLATGLAPLPPPVRIWLEVTMPTNRRRDSSNLAPTAKALIDGIVDAGVLPDDCDGVIEGPRPVRIYPNGDPHPRVVIQPIPAADLGRTHGEQP